METYETKTAGYEVFGANMTIDTKSDVHSEGYLAACQSCQCNCHLCRGGKAPDNEVFNKIETESALIELL